LISLNLRMLGAALLAFGIGTFSTASSAATADQPESRNPVGRWLTGSDGGVIEIDHCGGTALCGRIVGITLDHPGDPEPTDVHGKPQCGLTILTDAVKTGPDEWTGHITDPRDGQTYHARLSLDDSGQLHMRGYVGVPLLGQTVIWQPFQGEIGDNCQIVAPGAVAQRAVD
jgi:uncharacterized protein (DUF2147 family)